MGVPLGAEVWMKKIACSVFLLEGGRNDMTSHKRNNRGENKNVKQQQQQQQIDRSLT